MDTLLSIKDYLASLPLAAKIAGSVCAGVVTIWILKKSKGERRYICITAERIFCGINPSKSFVSTPRYEPISGYFVVLPFVSRPLEVIKRMIYGADDQCSIPVFKRKEYPKDTVILMQIGRGPYAPSLTPFAVKLETYLRMAKIPYENDHSAQKSSKGKFPSIIYNGQSIADSAFCIKFLNKTFDIDLNKGFNEGQKAVAHAWRKMLEENTYWTVLLHRWVYDKERHVPKMLGLSRLEILFVARYLKNMSYGHGMGRHTEEEVYEIMREDLQNVSQFIGTKKFLLGDRPCEEDCAVFGLLSQFYWQMFGHRNTSIMEDFPNLCSYCERMKETFWPDWNECITSTGK